MSSPSQRAGWRSAILIQLVAESNRGGTSLPALLAAHGIRLRCGCSFGGRRLAGLRQLAGDLVDVARVEVADHHLDRVVEQLGNLAANYRVAGEIFLAL